MMGVRHVGPTHGRERFRRHWPNHAWDPQLPLTSAECLAAMGLTNVAFWRMDLSTGGNVASLGNVAASLVRYGAPLVRVPFQGFYGTQNVNSGDTYSNLFSDVTLNPAANSFVFAWFGGLASDVAGTQHTAIAKCNNGNHGWLVYFSDNGDLNVFFSDAGGHTYSAVLASGVCPPGSSPLCLVGQVDWSGGGSPIFRARWSRGGVNLGSAQATLTGVTTLTVAASEFGFGGQPGIIAPGQTNGSGCWTVFGAHSLPGAQADGVTKALAVSQGLRFEQSYGSDTVAVPLGDSITVGAGDTGDRGGYRARLTDQVAGLRLVGTQTAWGGHHEGIVGQTIANMSARIDKIPMQLADTVILMAGTNDVGAGRTAVQVLNDLVALAEALILLPGVSRVLVSTIPPRDDIYTTVTDDINAGLEAALAGATAGIEFVDGCATLVNPTHFSDSVHPSTAGYEIIAANLAAAF